MKKMSKLFVSCLLLVVLALSVFAGCGTKKEDENKITVTFDANCTEITFTQTKKVKPGEAYGELPTITDARTGYTFDGWSAKKDGSGKAVTAETVVAETKGDHTLYARWKGNQYDLTFDLQGGKIGEETTVAAAKVTYGSMYGAMAIPNNPEKEGFKFVGWYLDAEGTGEKITMSTKVATAANHTLYAKWKEKTTNYTFDGPEMLEDWSKRNETNFNFEIANVDGNNMLKVTHNGTDKDNAWLVLWYNLKAGQTVTFDVKVVCTVDTSARFGFFLYGATAAGDPKTSGNLGEAGNGGWYWGQGYYSDESPEAWNNGTFSYTMNIKEDCYGVSMNMCFGRIGDSGNLDNANIWTNTVFYIDNVVIHDAA